jgi:acetylornithine deacetylase/succinyl-diaminopimelate desuccinylase-like protein
MFGGPAPDALIALIRTLATLHDENGDVAVAGLTSSQWTGAEYPGDLFRRLAGIQEGVDIIGTGPISSRIWSKPSVTVIGIDAPSVKDATNILIPVASAKISMRIAPGADPEREIRLLSDHLRAAAPWNVQVEISGAGGSAGFICPSGGRAFRLAKSILEAVYDRPAMEAGAGGSIPLLHTLKEAVPGAEFVLWGCEDNEHSRIHGANESVDLHELEQMILAQALLLMELGMTGNETHIDQN